MSGKKNTKYTNEFKQTIVNLYNSGKTYSQIQKEYGVSHNALANWVKQYSEVKIDDDDDFVSEELAEIYLNQGLYSQAIDTYRKLSLLNSEKSIYFAGLIAKIEEKRVNN